VTEAAAYALKPESRVTLTYLPETESPEAAESKEEQA